MAMTPSAQLKLPPDILFEGQWIVVNRLPLERRRVTRRYEVLTRDDRTCLAEIRWYGPWRCYVLAPKDGSIWESTCLADVVAFLAQLKLARAGYLPSKREKRMARDTPHGEL